VLEKAGEDPLDRGQFGKEIRNTWKVLKCAGEDGRRSFGPWTLRKGGHIYLESSEMLCWIRLEKIRWTDRVTNYEVLHRAKEEWNILHEIHIRKAVLVTYCVGNAI
jgi:hypothetical protein